MIDALSYFRLGWLMRELQASLLVNQIFALHHAADAEKPARLVVVNLPLGQQVEVPDPGMERVPSEMRDVVKATVEKLRDEAQKLKFVSSYDMAAFLLTGLSDPEYRLGSLAREVNDLQGRFVTELKYSTCLILVGEDEAWYKGPNQFKDAVADRFGKASYDIDEAAKCLALDRGTACVFHLMRVLEIGLQALGADLKLAAIEENWQRLLNDVDCAIRALPAKTDVEREHVALRAGAAAHLRNVKNGWRNDTIHPGEKYTTSEARDLWHHTGALMRHLASFL